MQKVNAIFKNTVWDEDRQIKDLGFHIKEMRIHTEYTDPSQYHSNNKHYNMDQSYWPDQELLAQFGHDKYFTNFCLAHLFTHRTFDKNVVGMAYIASSRKFTPWGICAKLGSNNIAFNTGLSSTMNTMGNNMLTQEAVLVTAHEFGHSWGAEHDADTRECAPLNKGRYLMFMFATSGFEENNDDFSPCSKRYVTEVLLANAGSCFKESAAENEQEGLEPKVPMCGNGVIDKGEMCDSGGFGISGMDPCCDSQCRLQENATCSPVNSECCKNCTMAPRGMVCRGASKEQCLQSAICSGFSFDCPASTPMPDTPEVKCIDEGVCKGGRCQSYCQRHLADSVPCICTTPGEECLRCCQEQDQVCQKINASHFLTDGRPCSYGYCKAGVCIGVRANMVQRLFAFIEKLTPNTLVAFMKSNIVGTIIVFSLVIWVPASWTVSCLDKKRGKLNRKYQDQWVSSETLLNRSFQSSVFANSVDNYKVKDTGPWPTYHGASSNVYLPPSPDEKKNKLPPLIMPPEKYFETTFKFNDHSGRPNESVVWETVM
uniref:Peptidase M12B domain-containing protein n=1 Tax=Biomphalaria glabrata TaxID=6526 RepID=A0A2C9L9U4_BIOGL